MSYFVLYFSTCNPLPTNCPSNLQFKHFSNELIWKSTLSNGPLEMALQSFKVWITINSLNGFTTYQQHSVSHAFSFDVLKKGPSTARAVDHRTLKTRQLPCRDCWDVDSLVCPALLFRRLQEAITQDPLHWDHVICWWPGRQRTSFSFW